ncbi:ABC transporter ATP-binding protein [Spartinivicinus ruber]|uniref:ABC transporter ATP-binding protein n=1 Tax=Spartinivicinus ruber TaxID=2683272 RepID=UPI0013D32F2E|nr:ABC transporter ATP-binding protein [Spartinivicinus ruber]
MKSLALEINDLHKTYENGHEALKGISLTVEQGDFFALLGPNGAGKSTTIGIISSLINKTAGDVAIFGYNLEQQRYLAKKQLGVVPQEFNFNQFEKTRDILVTQGGYYGMRPQQAKKQADHYLKQLGIWDKRDVPARMLSGGMKRRLMIARALIHEPQLLILDEPTAGVDIELRRSMWEFLTDINKNRGITIILTTHYLEEAEQLCRNIAIIDKGNLVENTSMKSLLRKLHLETFIFDTQQAISQSPTVNGYPVRVVDDHTLEVQVEKSQGLNSLFSQLSQQQIEVTSMRNKANRLEELFVSLVEASNGK